MKKLIYLLIVLFTVMGCVNTERTYDNDYEIIKPVSLVILNGVNYTANDTFLHIKNQQMEDGGNILTYWFEINDWEGKKFMEEKLGIYLKSTLDNAKLMRVKDGKGYIIYDDEMQYFHCYYANPELILDHKLENVPKEIYVIHFDMYER